MTSTLIESTSDTAEIAGTDITYHHGIRSSHDGIKQLFQHDRNQKTADHAIRKHMLLLFHFSLNSPIIHFQTLPAVMPTLTLCSFPQDNASFYQRTYYGSSSYAIRGLHPGHVRCRSLQNQYFSNTCCITLLSVCVSIRICGTCALQ